MKNIVILDGYTANPGDLSWAPLEALGHLTVFDRTPPNLVAERAANADIVLTNKAAFDAATLAQLPKLRLVSVLATGYNVVDVAAARELGVTVCNVRGYAANAVAQHVFALILAITNRIAEHNQHTAEGGWAASLDWSYTLTPIWELAGKTMGIYGFGQIGQRVADIAQAFGMRVVATHKHPERDRRAGVDFVSFDELLSQSDILSLHAPLSPENQGIVNLNSLAQMKPSALLINTGRGGLIVEADLKTALETGLIAGAGLDVLTEEPPRKGSPLIGLSNCLVTPHNAWATREARQRMIEESAENVRAFLAGWPRNLVGS
ncbi:MAG: D-2-hydroxyacid dehydrogenase [Saprospiraceae bacterium]|nr:D-2-hydroxyacid dehydrogenase [Saprospiraceae bacterium]MCF8249624.1 D-2-hydroxyacid dehydrogenase [Saprospiraceae bacterium]MCF8280434.1 D-2-hydroxyacid dehydrogenase [Bacteroidales bacterium]MCF8310456.1 D-2-hydroxyacid dehydrogenase [Saprospiraceae bacterium]MCF8439834.1 D-2-hydroxyacid dehydrogenase [Saprospiraceae bacterium]